ncbi:hypothetical protein HW452_05320 [Halomonas aquamarina]|uniref:Uncharacterized protein n=1 Tax=Vreelandella aquamarina TaxID=77097 RepID=A0ACC5VTF8_9GAMM|nr:hypothetical protein [Halomonas aquamarina]MBZ5486942.1 hypothetical protein [Halomonas aquamarina]
MKRHITIQLRAESICESIHDGDAEGVAKFAAYLDEVGDLTSAVDELTATTTIADMVAAYINKPGGESVMFAWAKDVAEDEQFSVEEDRAEMQANWAA